MRDLPVSKTCHAESLFLSRCSTINSSYFQFGKETRARWLQRWPSCERAWLLRVQVSGPHMAWQAHPCCQPWNVETRDSQSNMASKTGQIGELWAWLRGLASVKKVEELVSKDQQHDINNDAYVCARPPLAHTYAPTQVSTYICKHACVYMHIPHKETDMKMWKKRQGSLL